MPKHCVPSTETSTSASQEIDPVLLDVTDYTYDHSGNQLTTTRTTYTDGVAGTPVMVQSNTYDVWNQLIRTETENGTIVENAYNGDGRRVVKTVNGAATYYLYEYDKVILETNIYGDVTGRNVYGLNLLIRTVGVDTFYYMYNGHADVTALLTPSGTVAASYYYDAFGNILEQTGDVSNSVLFAGYQYDKETGLYYLNARMYDPVTARFMQEDTYAGQQSDPLSLNLYTYCHNSPLMYWDPTGHYAQTSQGIQAEIDRLYNTTQHNPGLFCQINALEAEKERLIQKEKDTKKKGLNKLVDFVKEVSVEAASEAIEILDEADRSGNLYDDWETILLTIRKEVPEIDMKYKEEKADEMIEAIRKKMKDDGRFSDQYDKNPTVRDEILIRDLKEIKTLYVNNEMTPEQEEKFWKAAFELGLPYDKSWTVNPANPEKYPYPYSKLDCSGFASYIYLEEKLPHNALSQSSKGTIIYKKGSSDSTINTFDEKELQVGDLVFYKLDDRAEITHVGMYMGSYKDENGDEKPMMIDAGTGERMCVSVRYLSCDEYDYSEDNADRRLRAVSRFLD